MSNYNSIEKIISEEILRTNEDNLIARKICNTVYSGDIKKKGDSVVLVGLSEPTVYNYTGTVSYEDVSDASMILNIDQDKAFSFKIKDIEELRSSIGLKESQARRASYNLKLEVDKYVLGLYAAAGQTYTDTTVTPSNVLKVLGEIKQKLEEVNVPDGRTFIVIPPFIKTKLMLAGIKFQINNGVNGTGTIGFTDELGYDVFVSNQLAKVVDGATTKYMVLAGSYSSIAYAEQVLETQILDKLENSFDKAVRGRLVFGAKVVKPNELVAAGLVDGTNEI
ncbi:MAG: hypothetical protein A2Y17_08070 [Clostridiales bacterium GWF2_38_85]|nr:MAG: hypothetical protein A2Y17_08070 [Clostridiales bacterium GWF2_38_85]HBL83852.1 hypothetical protein [Clostridiales bacterium]